MVNGAISPTRGPTPAIIENHNASGSSASATSIPTSTSIRRRRGLRSASHTRSGDFCATGTGLLADKSELKRAPKFFCAQIQRIADAQPHYILGEFGQYTTTGPTLLARHKM